MKSAEAQERFARDIVSRLRAAGFVALWAGGCVRDRLMGLPPKDYDVASDARPEQVIRLFEHTVPVGVSFGVVRVLGPRGSGLEIEVATFRSDDAYIDGRRPSSVTFSSPEVDASRRDFTINGMFYDPQAERVLDYVGGQADLEARTIRAIGDPAARFAEDKLRLLRAVRFASRLGFTIEADTGRALVAMAPQLRVVSAERIAQELRLMLEHPTRARAIELASELDLLGVILGRQVEAASAAAAVQVLGRLPAHASFTVAFAAVLCEVMPVAAGSKAVQELCRALRLSNEERERIAWLHARSETLEDLLSRDPTPAVLKRALSPPGRDELIALTRAREATRDGTSVAADFCEAYVRDEPDGPLDPPALLSGHDLLALGVSAGPLLARLLDQIRTAQLNGETTDRQTALDLARRLVERP